MQRLPLVKIVTLVAAFAVACASAQSAFAGPTQTATRFTATVMDWDGCTHFVCETAYVVRGTRVLVVRLAKPLHIDSGDAGRLVSLSGRWQKPEVGDAYLVGGRLRFTGRRVRRLTARVGVTASQVSRGYVTLWIGNPPSMSDFDYAYTSGAVPGLRAIAGGLLGTVAMRLATPRDKVAGDWVIVAAHK